jgi:hypothetical protein
LDVDFRQARPVPGVVLMRIDATDRAGKAERLIAAIDRFGEGLRGRYTVIEAARYRSPAHCGSPDRRSGSQTSRQRGVN